MANIPTLNDVQAVEPILTNLLLGYQQTDDRFIASKILKPVPVGNDSGTYWIFTKKYWFMDDLETRAPGSPFHEIAFGVETSTYSTLQYAAMQAIADEVRKNSQLPLDLETAAVNLFAQRSLIRKERAFSADWMQYASWASGDSNSTTDWDDFSAGDPVNDVLTAKRTVNNLTGYDPNTMAMGYIVHQALVNHPDVIDRIKYVGVAGVGQVESALGSVFGIGNYFVGKAVYNSVNEAQTFSAAAIIDDDCLVCYVAPAPGIMTASAGYTFTWDGGGGNGSIYRVRDDINHRDLIQHKEQWDQKVIATDLGYFFSDVV
jgi:hypothetical protein